MCGRKKLNLTNCNNDCDIVNNLHFKRIMWPLGKLIFIFFKLQTPASFAQSVQELTIALQRTGDPANLNRLRPHLELLANIDPSPGKPKGNYWTVLCALVLLSDLLNYFLLHSIISLGGYSIFFLQYLSFWPQSSLSLYCFNQYLFNTFYRAPHFASKFSL